LHHGFIFLGDGYCGFFVIFKRRGDDEGVAVAVVDGVLASATLDVLVVVTVHAPSKEGDDGGVWSPISRY
jgi:hypothetical protein